MEELKFPFMSVYLVCIAHTIAYSLSPIAVWTCAIML